MGLPYAPNPRVAANRLEKLASMLRHGKLNIVTAKLAHEAYCAGATLEEIERVTLANKAAYLQAVKKSRTSPNRKARK